MSQQQNVGPKKGDKEEESKIYRPKKNKKNRLIDKRGSQQSSRRGKRGSDKGEWERRS